MDVVWPHTWDRWPSTLDLLCCFHVFMCPWGGEQPSLQLHFKQVSSSMEPCSQSDFDSLHILSLTLLWSLFIHSFSSESYLVLNIWEGSALSIISYLAEIFSSLYSPLLLSMHVQCIGQGMQILEFFLGYFSHGLFRNVNFTAVGETYEIIWYFPDKMYASQRTTWKVPDQNISFGVS